MLTKTYMPVVYSGYGNGSFIIFVNAIVLFCDTCSFILDIWFVAYAIVLFSVITRTVFFCLENKFQPVQT